MWWLSRQTDAGIGEDALGSVRQQPPVSDGLKQLSKYFIHTCTLNFFGTHTHTHKRLLSLLQRLSRSEFAHGGEQLPRAVLVGAIARLHFLGASQLPAAAVLPQALLRLTYELVSISPALSRGDCQESARTAFRLALRSMNIPLGIRAFGSRRPLFPEGCSWNLRQHPGQQTLTVNRPLQLCKFTRNTRGSMPAKSRRALRW